MIEVNGQRLDGSGAEIASEGDIDLLVSLPAQPPKPEAVHKG